MSELDKSSASFIIMAVSNLGAFPVIPLRGADVEDNGAELYRRYLSGDGKALETLVARYSDALVRYAYCYLKDTFAAEDAAEDAFAALIVKRRPLPEDANLKAYLYKTVRNGCIDRIRAQKRQPPPAAAVDTELYIELEERSRVVFAAMQQLPEQYRGALCLIYFEGFRIEEAASILKRTRKQTYNLLARAKAALKQILVKKGVRYEDL